MNASVVSVTRQATFNAEPPDSVSGSSIRRGDIDIPVVDADTAYRGLHHQHQLGAVLSRRSPPLFTHQDDKSRTFFSGSRSNSSLTQARGAKSASNCGDSELDILSDVGLAGDSDTDVPPVKSPSPHPTHKKLRKKIRAKLASAKFNSGEPTIHEEKTQDVLAIFSPTQAQTVLGSLGAEAKGDYCSETDAAVYSTNKHTAISTQSSIESKSHRQPTYGTNEHSQDETRSRSTNVLQSESKDKINYPSNVQGEKINSRKVKSSRPPDNNPDLDSSFCESDWQPNPSKDITRTVNGEPKHGTTTAIQADDKSIIINKFETDVKPVYLARLDLGKRWAGGNRGVSNEPPEEASRNVKKSGRKPVEEEGPHVHNAKQENSDFTPQDAPALRSGNDFPPQRPRSLSQPKTPVISGYLEEEDDTRRSDDPVVSEYHTDSARAHPAPDFHDTRHGRQPSSAEIFGKERILASRDPPTANMENPDEYENETFEEVLQERNAMVKAERTYQKRIKQLEDELNAMIAQCQGLSDENKELRKALDDVKHSKEVNKDVGHATEKAELENTNEKLVARLKETEAKMKQWDTVFVENTKLKMKNSELEKKIRELGQTALSSSDNENKINALQSVEKEMKNALDEANYENKSLGARVRSLEEENTSLREMLEEKRKELKELTRALECETQTEIDLKASKDNLDKAQEEVNSLKHEMVQMRQMLNASEENRKRANHVLSQRDVEMKKLKGEHENKDRLIVGLRQTLEKTRQDASMQEASKETSDKEAMALKSRIGSLKAEIESSLAENHRLKQEREEANIELQHLRQENAATVDAVTDSKRYFRKWEMEKDLRNKAESGLARKEEQIQIMDTRLKEAGTRINVLHGRVRVLEDERSQQRSSTSEDIPAKNSLNEENKKLRQMLVERNIQLTNSNAERNMDSKLQTLETKYNDGETRARHVTGWVVSVNQSSSAGQSSDPPSKQRNLRARPPNPQYSQNPNKVRTENSRPGGPVSLTDRHGLVEPRPSYQSPRSRNNVKKRNAYNSVTPPPVWEEPRKFVQGNGKNHTPTSLPVILDPKALTPPDPNGGYFQMYQEKMKRMQERKF